MNIEDEMKQNNNDNRLIGMISVALLIAIVLIWAIFFRHSTPVVHPVKTVIFKPKNKLPGTNLIVQDGTKLDTISVDSTGEARYNLLYGKKIRLKSEAENIKIITDHYSLRYNEIMDNETILLSVYPNNDLSFEFKIVSEPGDIIDNATISSNQLDLSSKYLPKDSAYAVTVNKNQFSKNSIQLGDTFSIDIVAPGYNKRQYNLDAKMVILEPEQIILVSKVKKAIVTEKKQKTPKADLQITTFSLKVKDDEGYNLSGAMVLINDKKIKTTNSMGEVFHSLSLTSEPIKLLLSKKGYTHEIEEINLLPTSNSHISYLTPIHKGFKIIDSVTGDIVLGLNVESETILKHTFEDSIYWIQFGQFGNNSFKLTDPSGMYQDSDYDVEIQKNDIKTISENKIHRITHFIIKVIDDSGNPITGVTVNNKLGRKLGATGNNGVLRKAIIYSEGNYKYNIKYPKYFEIDTTVAITPGENKIEQRLRKFPEMVLTVQNQHNNEPITDLLLIINGKDYFTDDQGEINIPPNILNEKYEINYNDGDSKYYGYNSTIVYEPDNRKKNIILRPVAYINIKTYYFDGKTPMAGVNIGYGDKSLDVKNNQAEYSLKIPALNREYEITAGKDEYETKKIKVTPTDLHTEVKFVLDQLAATLLIVNVFDNPITDVTVRYAGSTSKVDRYGKVELIPKKLNSPIDVSLISPEKIYRDTTVTYNFTKNRDSKKIILLTIPFDLEVTIKNNIGIPADGTIKISPPPNPTKGAEYKLVNGKVNINIYESKDYWLIYDVSFPKGDKRYFVTNKNKIEVQLSKKKMFFRETIRGATVKTETKNKEILTITNMNNSNLIYSLKGDGIDEIDISDFGDYQFCYQPQGFNNPICEVRTVNSPHKTFYFTVDDNYEKGVIAEGKGDGETACDYFRKVPVGSPNYCDAIEKCIKISNNNKDLESSEKDIWTYIRAMSATECDENYSYYAKYLEVVAEVRSSSDTESETLDYYNELWGGDESKIREAYNRFRDLCPIMSSGGCEEKEVKVKIIILRGIADVMFYTKKVYDNTLDIDITKSCKNLNEHLYAIHQYYSRDLNVSKWDSEKRQIESAHID